MEAIIDRLKKRIADAGQTSRDSHKFQLLKEDESRVVYALEICNKYNVFPPAKAKCREQKCPRMSTKLRNEGNQIFVRNNSAKHFAEACELYSKSIAFGPNSSSELALAFANRSAVLFRLGNYEKCLDDMEKAMSLDYPNHLKAKLLSRKTECLSILDIRVKADDEEACEKEKKTKWGKKPYWFEKMLQNFAEAEKNSQVPCALDALEIKYNENFGRHVVATRDIQPAEIISVEKPYSLILMLENAYTHCSGCLEVSWASIPCENCVYAMYCSDECKNESWAKYHDVECGLFGHLVDLEMNNLGFFSLRLAILAVREAGSIKQLKQEINRAEKCDDPLKRGFSEDDKFHGDKYKSVYSLTTNTESRSMADLFDRALNAAFILYYLSSASTFFGTKLEVIGMSDLARNESVTFVGGLILRHQQIIPSNIHSQYSEERFLERVERGAAALPFFSLINHSCDPNVSRTSIKGHEILYPLYQIKKGEQIFDNYGTHYAMMAKVARQSKLKQQFLFDCVCLACRKDWPLYGEITSYKVTVKSPVVKSKLADELKNLDEYIDDATRGDIEEKPEILKNLSRMTQELVRHVSLPCIEVNHVQETLKRVFELLGNRFELPKCIL